MKSVSVCGRVLVPGAQLEVSVADWLADPNAAKMEESGLLRRVNPMSTTVYLVRSSLPKRREYVAEEVVVKPKKRSSKKSSKKPRKTES